MTRWWLWAALGVALLLVSSGQTWVSGTVVDPVLGGTQVRATGGGAGGTLVAGALLAGAAFLAGLVGSRPVRLASAVCLVGGAVLAGVPAVRSLSAPGEVTAQVAAELPGSVGSTVLIEDPVASAWPWVALLGAVLVLASGVLRLLGALRARPVDETERAAEARASRREQRAVDPWEELSRGQDPTLDD